MSKRAHDTRTPTSLDPAAAAGWLTPQLAKVLAAAAAWGFSFSTFYLLPKYLSQDLGAGAAEVGLVTGLFAVATVALTPLAGRGVDRYSHRATICAGALLMAVAAFGFLATDGVGPLMLALRIVQGLSHALVFTAVGVAVADCVPPSRLAQALGLAGACMLVMNAIAPAIIEPLAAVAGWEAAFALSGAIGLGAAALALTIGGDCAANGPEPTGSTSMMSVLSQPLAIHYAIVVACAGVTFGTVFTFHQPFALDAGRLRVGGFFLAFASAALFIRVFFGHLPDRLGRHAVATGSLAVYAATVFVFALVGPAYLELVGIAFGLSHGLFYPAINAIAVTGVARCERGRIMAIFTGAFNAGVASTTLLGSVAAAAGYPAVLAIAAAVAAAAVIVLAGSQPLRQASRQPKAADDAIAQRSDAVARRS